MCLGWKDKRDVFFMGTSVNDSLVTVKRRETVNCQCLQCFTMSIVICLRHMGLGENV